MFLERATPTLRLSLDFIRKVYVEPYVSSNEKEGTLTDIIKVY